MFLLGVRGFGDFLLGFAAEGFEETAEHGGSFGVGLGAAVRGTV